MIRIDDLAEEEEQDWAARVVVSKLLYDICSHDGFSRPGKALDSEQAVCLALQPFLVGVAGRQPVSRAFEVGGTVFAEFTTDVVILCGLQPFSDVLDDFGGFGDDLFGVVVAQVVGIYDDEIVLARGYRHGRKCKEINPGRRFFMKNDEK